MREATPIGSSPSSSPSEAQAAWARPLRSSPLRSDHHHRHRHHRQRRKRHGRGHSDHRHCHRCRHCHRRHHRHHHRRSDLADLSLSLSLFWWLVVLIVGGWLILVDGGRLISCGCEICDVYEILVYGVFFFFFFFCIGV